MAYKLVSYVWMFEWKQNIKNLVSQFFSIKILSYNLHWTIITQANKNFSSSFWGLTKRKKRYIYTTLQPDTNVRLFSTGRHNELHILSKNIQKKNMCRPLAVTPIKLDTSGSTHFRANIKRRRMSKREWERLRKRTARLVAPTRIASLVSNTAFISSVSLG